MAAFYLKNSNNTLIKLVTCGLIAAQAAWGIPLASAETDAEDLRPTIEGSSEAGLEESLRLPKRARQTSKSTLFPRARLGLEGLTRESIVPLIGGLLSSALGAELAQEAISGPSSEILNARNDFFAAINDIAARDGQMNVIALDAPAPALSLVRYTDRIGVSEPFRATLNLPGHEGEEVTISAKFRPVGGGDAVTLSGKATVDENGNATVEFSAKQLDAAGVAAGKQYDVDFSATDADGAAIGKPITDNLFTRLDHDEPRFATPTIPEDLWRNSTGGGGGGSDYRRIGMDEGPRGGGGEARGGGYGGVSGGGASAGGGALPNPTNDLIFLGNLNPASAAKINYDGNIQGLRTQLNPGEGMNLRLLVTNSGGQPGEAAGFIEIRRAGAPESEPPVFRTDQSVRVNPGGAAQIMIRVPALPPGLYQASIGVLQVKEGPGGAVTRSIAGPVLHPTIEVGRVNASINGVEAISPAAVGQDGLIRGTLLNTGTRPMSVVLTAEGGLTSIPEGQRSEYYESPLLTVAPGQSADFAIRIASPSPGVHVYSVTAINAEVPRGRPIEQRRLGAPVPGQVITVGTVAATLSGVTTAGLVSPGATAFVNGSVTNTGSRPAVFTLAVEGGITGGPKNEYYDTTINVPAGATADFQVAIPNIAPGVHVYSVTPINAEVSRERPIAERRAGPPVTGQVITAGTVAATLSGVGVVDDQINPGDPGQIRGTITNNGTRPAVFTITAEGGLAGTPESERTEYNDTTVTVPAGASVPFTINIPSVSAGIHIYTVTPVNAEIPRERPIEERLAGPRVFGQVITAGSVAASLSQITLPAGPVAPGSTPQITGNVTNTGNRPAVFTITVEGGLAGTPEGDRTEYYDTTVNVPAGATVPFTVNIHGIAPGVHIYSVTPINAEIPRERPVSERRAGDSVTGQQIVAGIAAPTLAAEDVDFPDDPAPVGSSVRVDVNVGNVDGTRPFDGTVEIEAVRIDQTGNASAIFRDAEPVHVDINGRTAAFVDFDVPADELIGGAGVYAIAVRLADENGSVVPGQGANGLFQVGTPNVVFPDPPAEPETQQIAAGEDLTIRIPGVTNTGDRAILPYAVNLTPPGSTASIEVDGFARIEQGTGPNGETTAEVTIPAAELQEAGVTPGFWSRTLSYFQQSLSGALNRIATFFGFLKVGGAIPTFVNPPSVTVNPGSIGLLYRVGNDSPEHPTTVEIRTAITSVATGETIEIPSIFRDVPPGGVDVPQSIPTGSLPNGNYTLALRVYEGPRKLGEFFKPVTVDNPPPAPLETPAGLPQPIETPAPLPIGDRFASADVNREGFPDLIVQAPDRSAIVDEVLAPRSTAFDIDTTGMPDVISQPAANFPVEPAAQLAAARKQLGLTQPQFAKLLAEAGYTGRNGRQVAQSTISRWENGVNPVPQPVIDLLPKLLAAQQGIAALDHALEPTIVNIDIATALNMPALPPGLARDLSDSVFHDLSMLSESAQGAGVLVFESELLGTRVGLEEFINRAPADLTQRIILFGVTTPRISQIAARRGIIVVASGRLSDLAITLAAMPKADRVSYLGSAGNARQLQSLLPASMAVAALDPQAGLQMILLALGIPQAVLDGVDVVGLEEDLTLLHSA